MSKVVFSGVQPSGNLHIGNYIGALRQWVELQNENDAIFCIVDLHAITVSQDSKVLKEKVLEVAALYVASGIDPEKAHVFVQSENPDHTYLAWILNTITPFGQLERMTQFKDKSEKHEANAGLFDYPVLMASDILLYDTDEVPVGEDQKQHIELTRDLAEKFNSKFGQVFKVPSPQIQKETARIMSLQNPDAKMSKSDTDPLGTINLLDSESEIVEKIKRAVTDSGSQVSKESSPAVSNLLTIYSALSNKSFSFALDKFEGQSYSKLKEELTDLLVATLKPIQLEYKRIRENEAQLRKILDKGRDYAIEKSSKKVDEVKKAVGLI